MRFEVSHIQSEIVKSNVIIQLNRVSNDLAKRVAEVIGQPAPSPDPKFYNNNSTAFVSIFNYSLPTIAGLNVGILTSVKSSVSLSQAAALKTAFASAGVNIFVVGETLAAGINQTYSAADATGFDGIVVAAGAESLFTNGTTSTFFPADRPLQILTDGYRWGKPVGTLGNSSVLKLAGVSTTAGVFTASAADVGDFVKAFEGGLKVFKFVDRFPVDQ
jgi:catalase